jgi:hypothetical protein
MSIRFAAAVSLAALAACASGGTPSSDPGAPEEARPVSRGPQDVISYDELADPSLGDTDALTVVRRLRPAFLAYRGAVSVNNSQGGSVHVSFDGGALRPVDALSTLRASQVVEIRYLGASAAAQRFGTGAMAGPVIMVKLR